MKKIHYPYLGLLALTATNETKVNEIVTIHNLLMELKIFKHAKQFALVIAIQKVVRDLMDMQEMIDLTPMTNIMQLLNIADLIFDISSAALPSGIDEVFNYFN